MCGIAGVYRDGGIREDDIAAVRQMNHVQAHRGPDDHGMFANNVCALGHRRLAIIDLTSDGHQPFISDDGRYVLVYNGEIYNYIELRDELEKSGWSFKTKTDTEVLLNAFRQYGIACLHKLNGMFAFALYDTLQQSLYMARDRFGIKPLYYMYEAGMFTFASEIKALHAIVKAGLTLNRQSVFDYLVFNRTDVFDETFFCEVKRIPKGHFAVIEHGQLRINQWWSPEDYMGAALSDTPRQAGQMLEELLVSAVKIRMRSDVPVGSCLSGGLDSSVLVGILFKHFDPGNTYATFTASFPGHPIDESMYVDALNRIYPFSNFRTYPTGDIAFNHLKEFVYVNDEPTTSPSFFSQFEVMRKAKAHGVTVLLDGQGGDENFAGYQYFHGFNLYGMLNRGDIPGFCLEFGKSVLRRQHISAYQTLLFQVLPDKLKKAFLYSTVNIIDREFFNTYIETSRIYNEFFTVTGLNQSLVRHFQYKLEHLLRMEDRNSMAFSLEARVPYLDYRLVEFMLGLPECMKIKDGETKVIQKSALGKYTAADILSRKDKVGFGTPGTSWMREPQWHKLTLLMHQELIDWYPDIFKPNTTIPDNCIDAWKINQLGVWKSIFSPAR